MPSYQAHLVAERGHAVTYLFGSAPRRPSLPSPPVGTHAVATLAPTRPVTKGDEPLASVATQLGCELAADAVLVAWHAPGENPVLLFSSGACQPESSIEQDMITAASEELAGSGAPLRWRTRGAAADALLTTSVDAIGGSFTVTSLFCRLGKAESDAAQNGIHHAATRMLPMLESFLRLLSLRDRAVAENRGLTAALNNIDVATLSVDARGRLLFVNAAAERLLSANDGLRRSGALLGGTRLADTMRLQATIEHVIHGAGGKLPPSPVVALNRKTGRPLLAAVIAVGRDPEAASDTAAVVHVFDPDSELEPVLAPVCRLYNLSAVEGRLTSLLSAGYALADAAKQMRVQEQTARSYLKQVFVKTDTNRQAELVLLMLKSAVRVAQGGRLEFAEVSQATPRPSVR